MDFFAALALATEPPLIQVLKSGPNRRFSVLTTPIWRQVIFMSFYNAAIILFIMLFGRIAAKLQSFDNYIRVDLPKGDKDYDES